MSTWLELQDDFNDGDEEFQENDGMSDEGENGFNDGETKDNEGDEEMADEEKEAQSSVTAGPSDIRSAEALIQQLKPVLADVARYQKEPDQRLFGSTEENPEYKLLTEANTLSTSIDNEIVGLHKFIRDHYSPRFPYLEKLVLNPLDYAKTVAIIGNGPMDQIKQISMSADNMVGRPLAAILDKPSLMVITVEATTSDGHDLSDAELAIIRRACGMTFDLDKAKRTLTDYVESRMNIFAPNLTVLIGSKTAAQLLNYAGGITGLAKTPACNIAPLGSNKAGSTGLATNVGIRHQGFLYQSPIVSHIRPDLKKQAMRIVSAKVVLAARVDSVHDTPDGSTGERLKEECLHRLDKLTEPPPNKGVRALPAPDDKPSRKRGGRRARKAKEATAMTEIRKAQNRMAFGKEELEVGYGTGDTTAGLGMIGQDGTGRIRAQQIDTRTKAKLSKKNPGWGGDLSAGGMASSLRGFAQGGIALSGHGLRQSGVNTTSGTSSSIVFTAAHGIELVDPKVRAEMNRKRKAEEDRWFKSGTFTQVGGSTSSGIASGTGSAATDSAGFKIPQLPPRKKVDTGASK